MAASLRPAKDVPDWYDDALAPANLAQLWSGTAPGSVFCSRISRKLDIKSRIELARLVDEHYRELLSAEGNHWPITAPAEAVRTNLAGQRKNVL